MSDPQPRGGRKQAENPQASEHQNAGANQPTEGSHPAGQTRKPIDRPKDDPSEAPESGDRKATGNT